LTITNNTIVYDQVSTGVYDDAWHGGDKYSAGILLMSVPVPSSPAPTQTLNNVFIYNNVIHCPLTNGIWVYGTVNNNCTITGNTITNPGISSLISDAETAAIRLDGDKMNGVYVPGWPGNLNIFQDMRSTKKMKYGLYTSSPVDSGYYNYYRTIQTYGLAAGGSSFYSTLGGGGWTVVP
jgi:hypothetical protein